ncbi:hypothetical protein [Streptomyces fractus]|uniref:hypothetical protein n=1 Tax=Streptomyces fractus TaxID=641806 RepID=UPI003CE97047
MSTDHQDEPEVADFDAFFAEQTAPRFGATLRLYGRDYHLPSSLPLLFTLQMERVKNSEDPDDIRRLLSSLFGPRALDEWAEHGMTDKQLGVVLLWAAANTREPGSLTIAGAVALYDEQEADKEAGGEGKDQAPTPKTIANASGGRS